MIKYLLVILISSGLCASTPSDNNSTDVSRHQPTTTTTHHNTQADTKEIASQKPSTTFNVVKIMLRKDVENQISNLNNNWVFSTNPIGRDHDENGLCAYLSIIQSLSEPTVTEINNVVLGIHEKINPKKEKAPSYCATYSNSQLSHKTFNLSGILYFSNPGSKTSKSILESKLFYRLKNMSEVSPFDFTMDNNTTEIWYRPMPAGQVRFTPHIEF